MMQPPQTPADLFNPFPGLRPFEFDESNLFFGRDGQSDELSRRLRRNRFLAVVGTSGSGKSSLVRAGLLPALYGGFMTQAGPGWRVAVFRPGNDPIGNLARALADPAVCGAQSGGMPPEAEALLTEATLRRGALGLVTAIKQARLPKTENLLIVVDQFEEIFRFKQVARGQNAEDDAAAFVKLLLEAAKQTDLPVYVLITMRSDFLGDCAQFRDLPEAINDGQYLIPRMTRDQRREAITGPVAVGGAQMTPRLVNRLLNDVGDNPDQLPILQHALMRTWDHWSRQQATNANAPLAPLDTPDYEAVGGMATALSRHADEAYAELPDDRARLVAERVFKTLTEKGQDNREIRRPTPLSQLVETAGATEAEVVQVIEIFRRPGRSFLMPPASVALRPDSLIDISHESLIRGWQRLRDWTDAEAQSAQIYRRLAETAALQSEGRAGLWRDPDLAVALAWRDEQQPNEAWAARYAPNFADALRFLTDSQAAREAEIAQREEHRRRDIRRTRLFTLFLGIAFIAALCFGLYAYSAGHRAVLSAQQAELSRRLAVEQAQLARQHETEAEAARQQATASLAVAEERRKQAEEARQQAEQARQQAERAQAAEHTALAAEHAALAAQQEAVVAAQAARSLAEQNLSAAKAAQARAAESEKKWQAEALAAQKQTYEDNDLIRSMADRLVQVTPRQEAVIWRTIKANALTNLGNHKEAETELTATLNADPDNFRARQLRGYMYMLTRQPDKSVEDLRAVLQEQPDSSLGHLNLSVGLSLNGRYDEARREAEAATRLFVPGEYETLIENEVAPDIKQVTGRDLLSTSDQDFRTALEYQRANVEAYVGGDFPAALAHARQRPATPTAYLTALNWAWLNEQQRPEDYGTLAAQGALWEQAGYRENALRAYAAFLDRHRAAQQQPTRTLAAQRYVALARWVAERQRALDPAGSFGHSRAAELAHADDARSAPALALEARRLLARANVTRAHEELQQATNELERARAEIAKASGSTDLLEAVRQRAQLRHDRAREDLRRARADAERARQLLDRAVELEPGNLSILQQRMRLRFNNAENPTATPVETEAKQTAPNLQAERAVVRRAPATQAQAYRAALEDAEAILHQSPRNSTAYYYRALVRNRLLGLGDKDVGFSEPDVVADARKAVEIDPLNADAAIFLALYIADTKPDEALRLFQRTLKIYPGTPWVYQQIAMLENRLGAHADARAAIEQAIALHLGSPDKRDDADTLKLYYDELEKAEAGLGVPEAVRQRRKAERLVTLGDAALHLGQPREAYNTYTRAREQYQLLAAAQPTAASTRQTPAAAQLTTAEAQPVATAAAKPTAALDCDLARVAAKIAEVYEVGREKKVYSSVVSSVLAVAPGTGNVREVTMARGARDGVPDAGAKVAVASVYDEGREVKQIGTGEIVRVEPDTTLVRVTLNEPTGNGLVRAGDSIEHKALVPDLPVRSVLWRIAAEFNITFLDMNSEPTFFDYRKLYADETPELVDSVLDRMVADIHATARRDDLKDALTFKVAGGRFKDQTLGQAMLNTKRADLLGFLKFVEEFPGKYYGKRWKINETYATWVINNTPEAGADKQEAGTK